MRHIVLLGCGHWFRESAREDIRWHPVDGEERACSQPEHYPRKFPAVYLADAVLAPLGEGWMLLPGDQP